MNARIKNAITLVMVAPPRLQALRQKFLLEENASLLRHDLRNKVASIRNATFYLRRRVEAAAAELWREDERVSKFFGLIQSELTEVEGLLTSFAPPVGAPEPGAPLAADALIGGLLASLSPTGDVRIAMAEGDSVPLRGDGAELELALFCLVENAVEAAASEVRVRCTRRDGAATIEVTDDGPGPTDEALVRGFEPRFSTKDGRPGLGLNVARRIAGRWRATVELARGERGGRASMVVPAADAG